MSDLTSLANVKQWLAITTSTDDALLTRLIGSASDYIEAWLNRNLSLQAYTSYRDGIDSTRMMFRNYPVVSVSTVSVDGVVIQPSVNGRPGYVFNDTSVSLIGYRFTKGYSNVYFAYSAGFAVIPSEIEQACIELVGLRYKDRDRIGINSKTLAGETITFTSKDFSDAVETTLKQYRRVALP